MTVVSWLREEGHDATHLREEGLQRLADDKIFDKATREGRVVLTFDLDFSEIAALTGDELTSVPKPPRCTEMPLVERPVGGDRSSSVVRKSAVHGWQNVRLFTVHGR